VARWFVTSAAGVGRFGTECEQMFVPLASHAPGFRSRWPLSSTRLWGKTGDSKVKKPAMAWLMALAFVVLTVTGCNATGKNSAARSTKSTVAIPSATAMSDAPSTLDKPVAAPTTALPPSTTATTTLEPPPSRTVLAGLAILPVKGRAPLTGYSRDQFGTAWTDEVTVADGHNGCDTRNDILRRDLTKVVVKPGTHGCTVTSGVLHDPYTNTSSPSPGARAPAPSSRSTMSSRSPTPGRPGRSS
jgi:hypothetical protein